MGLLDGLFGGGGDQTQTTVSEPWKPQQQYLLDVFKQAQNTFANNPGPYMGQTYAGFSPEQYAALSGMYDFAGGPGAALANQGVQSAASLGGFAPAFAMNSAGLVNRTAQDPTQGILANAAQYADNPYTQSIIDAMAGDVGRNLGENVLTGIDTQAVGYGNTNSTRTGIAEGLARRGAAEEIAQQSAGIRGGLFNQGLQQAQDAWKYGLGASLDANAQLGQGTQLGAGLRGSSLNDVYSNIGNAFKAGTLAQQDEQGRLSDAFNMYNYRQNYPWQNLQNYLGAVGGSYGGTQTTTVDAPDPNPFGQLLGIAGMGLGMFGPSLGIMGGYDPYSGINWNTGRKG